MAEIAALASAHSTHLIESTTELPDAPLHAFWMHSKQRLHGWIDRLDQYPHDIQAAPIDNHPAIWKGVEPVIQEVFVSEILTRVWSGVLAAIDHRRGLTHAAPIARSVLTDQLQARKRCLDLMVNGSHESLGHVARLDQLRRKAERWTDLLLGHLVIRYDVGEFAFDEQTAREFGARQTAWGSEHAAWNLILAGMRLALPVNQVSNPPAADHGVKIARAVLATFPTTAFSTEGPFKSILHGRIARSGTHPEESPHEGANCRPLNVSVNSVPTLKSAGQGLSFSNLRRRRDRTEG